MTRRGNSRSDGGLTARPQDSRGAPTLPPGIHEVGGAARGPHLLVVPPAARAPMRLLVFFHGAGGRAADSLTVLRQTDDAPDEADVGAEPVALLLPTSEGATWDLLVGGLGPDLLALDEALAASFQALPINDVAVGGFSDGASYALSLALANGHLAAAGMAFSPGFVAPPRQIGRPRLWVSHGRSDRVLPVERCGRRVVRTLSEAGYDVRYDEFDGGHDITPDLVRQAFSWWRHS